MRLRTILALPLLAFLTTAVGAHAATSALSLSAPPICLGKAAPLFSSSQQGLPAWPNGISSVLSFPKPHCGACSEAICGGAVLYSQCGYGTHGSILVCTDFGMCPADGSYACRCTPPQ